MRPPASELLAASGASEPGPGAGATSRRAAPPAKRTGWRLFLASVVGRAYPRVIGAQRELSWMFFEIVLPLLTVLAYVWVYRALDAPPEYTGFVLLGGAMTAFWANVLWAMSSQLYWEKEQGNLALYIMAPASLMSLLLGMAVGGLIGTTLRAVVILVIGALLFHVPFEPSGVPLLLGVFVLTMAALYGLGMMLSSLFLLLNREAWHLANLAQEPVYLLSGFFFPVSSLPFWLTTASSVIPLTLGLDAMRQLVFPPGSLRGLLPVGAETALLGILAVLYIALARWLLAHMERLAIREGRLTEARR
jgi:ABC-2 type transport system permease protein